MSKAFDVQVTPVLDTSIYADGDTLSDIFSIAGAIRRAGLRSRLVSVTVLDKDDQGIAFDIYLFDRSVTLSAKNAAWNTSDSDMAFGLGRVQVLSGDYVDEGGNRMAHPDVPGEGLIVKANSGTTIYGALRSRGAGTYTASGLVITFGFEQD